MKNTSFQPPQNSYDARKIKCPLKVKRWSYIQCCKVFIWRKISLFVSVKHIKSWKMRFCLGFKQMFIQLQKHLTRICKQINVSYDVYKCFEHSQFKLMQHVHMYNTIWISPFCPPTIKAPQMHISMESKLKSSVSQHFLRTKVMQFVNNIFQK